MDKFVKYILDTLHYPNGEMSFCGKSVFVAADTPELRKSTNLAEMTPAIYDIKLGGASAVELLWERLLLLWVFDSKGFQYNDWGTYLETGDESYIIPHVIRRPLEGFETPFTWSGADCDPYVLLCLARYYDYGTVCIRFLRKWQLFVDKLYVEGHCVFDSCKLAYNEFLTRITQRVTELLGYLVKEVPTLPDFQEYLFRHPNSVYKELVGRSNVTSTEIDAILDMLNEFFAEFCREY